MGVLRSQFGLWGGECGRLGCHSIREKAHLSGRSYRVLQTIIFGRLKRQRAEMECGRDDATRENDSRSTTYIEECEVYGFLKRVTVNLEVEPLAKN